MKSIFVFYLFKLFTRCCQSVVMPHFLQHDIVTYLDLNSTINLHNESEPVSLIVSRSFMAHDSDPSFNERILPDYFKGAEYEYQLSVKQLQLYWKRRYNPDLSYMVYETIDVNDATITHVWNYCDQIGDIHVGAYGRRYITTHECDNWRKPNVVSILDFTLHLKNVTTQGRVAPDEEIFIDMSNKQLSHMDWNVFNLNNDETNFTFALDIRNNNLGSIDGIGLNQYPKTMFKTILALDNNISNVDFSMLKDNMVAQNELQKFNIQAIHLSNNPINEIDLTWLPSTSITKLGINNIFDSNHQTNNNALNLSHLVGSNIEKLWANHNNIDSIVGIDNLVESHQNLKSLSMHHNQLSKIYMSLFNCVENMGMVWNPINPLTTTEWRSLFAHFSNSTMRKLYLPRSIKPNPTGSDDMDFGNGKEIIFR